VLLSSNTGAARVVSTRKGVNRLTATGLPDPEALAVEWSRHLFDLLADGGHWWVPRSGVGFRKEGDVLVEIEERMPWAQEMPLTEAELEEQQRSDADAVERFFGLAGIHVTRRRRSEPVTVSVTSE
jgi:hypothetical protein